MEKDTPAARELLRRHIGTLILTPTAEGYVFDGGFLLELGERDPITPAEFTSAGVSGYSGSGGAQPEYPETRLRLHALLPKLVAG